MKVKTILCLLALLVSYSQNAYSSSMTAKQLKTECEFFADENGVTPKSALEKLGEEQLMQALFSGTRCASYIDGVLDAYQLLADLNLNEFKNSKNYEINICLPKEGVEIEKIIGLYIKFINQFPSSETMTARVSVLKSLEHWFPCKTILK